MDLREARTRLIEYLQTQIKDKRVLEALSRVPRELFIPPELIPSAYEDRPLPIGYNQTISQPYIIATMTEALELKGQEKVLEVGTGSGYQAAILSLLAHKIITVERILPLAEAAGKLLKRLGYANIDVHHVTKELGLKSEAPYDAIIVTAAAPVVPKELMDQMAEGGRMAIPVGARYEQDLLKIVKRGGQEIRQNLGGCRFVPLIGPGAWEESELMA